MLYKKNYFEGTIVCLIFLVTNLMLIIYVLVVINLDSNNASLTLTYNASLASYKYLLNLISVTHNSRNEFNTNTLIY